MYANINVSMYVWKVDGFNVKNDGITMLIRCKAWRIAACASQSQGCFQGFQNLYKTYNINESTAQC